MRTIASLTVVLAALAGCATHVPHHAAPDGFGGWHPVPIPGKRATAYSHERHGGRMAIRAEADASASLWRRRVDLPAEALSDVQWSWWVDGAMPQADLTDSDRSDAPARVVFAFDGDRSRLPQRTRMMFELARTLSGEEPPYATLMYVWSSALPVGTIVTSQRSDRIRKIVVDGGPGSLRRWREHRRNLKADFQRAFGEPPGRLVGVALMTDADNTRSSARAWYGDIELRQ